MGRKQDLSNVEVRLVPAKQLGPNPRNPYDRLTPEERHACYVELMARIYRRVLKKAEEKQSGKAVA